MEIKSMIPVITISICNNIFELKMQSFIEKNKILLHKKKKTLFKKIVSESHPHNIYWTDTYSNRIKKWCEYKPVISNIVPLSTTAESKLSTMACIPYYVSFTVFVVHSSYSELCSLCCRFDYRLVSARVRWAWLIYCISLFFLFRFIFCSFLLFFYVTDGGEICSLYALAITISHMFYWIVQLFIVPVTISFTQHIRIEFLLFVFHGSHCFSLYDYRWFTHTMMKRSISRAKHLNTFIFPFVEKGNLIASASQDYRI